MVVQVARERRPHDLPDAERSGQQAERAARVALGREPASAHEAQRRDAHERPAEEGCGQQRARRRRPQHARHHARGRKPDRPNIERPENLRDLFPVRNRLPQEDGSGFFVRTTGFSGIPHPTRRILSGATASEFALRFRRRSAA